METLPLFRVWLRLLAQSFRVAQTQAHGPIFTIAHECVLPIRTRDVVIGALRGICQHVFVLKGGMGAKQRKQVAKSLALVSTHEPRMILATGSYLGEGFDDARLTALVGRAFHANRRQSFTESILGCVL